MKINLSTVLLVIIVVLVNLFSSAYVSQTLASRIVKQDNSSEEIAALTERVDVLSERLTILTDYVESRLGFIRDLHPINDDRDDELFKDGLVIIGVIPSTYNSYLNYFDYVEKIIEPDLNNLARSMGSDLTFDFEVRNADGQAAVHLEQVQYLDTLGANLIIGGMWSSHACASVSYCNDNGLILFSPSSTSPLPAIPDDNLFRLCPTDVKQAPVIADVLKSQGVEAVVLIQRGDSWADGIYESVKEEYESLGGNVVSRIRYPGESTEFTKYLEDAEAAAVEAVNEYGWDQVAVELLSFSEAAAVLQQAEDYPTLYNLTWFGSDGNYNSQMLIEDAPGEVEHVKLYTFNPVLPNSETLLDVETRYLEGSDLPTLQFYTAASYDIAMILGKAVIEADTIDPDILKEKIAEVAYDYEGITGLCRLDEADDRATTNYGIFEYSTKNGELGCHQVGLYSDLGEVTWFED